MSQAPPQKIGKYEILELLGRGGMGVVYKARDPFIDRIVAIKTITVSGSIDEADLLERLKMEARSAGRLHHPNIVTVFDFGEEGGVPYIVMEYAEGVDIAQFIESGRQLSLPKKLDILIGTCQGLAYAHELGVIHRDMKPSNVRLTTKNVPKILDFGLARFDTTRLTRTGFMSGTIAYMSPERINGQTGASDDIFALGTIAYELLTYRRAFPGSTPPEVMMKIISQSPPAPSTVAEVPQGLDAIVAKCMAREVSERYPGAREFADVLHDFERSEEMSQFVVSENRSEEFRKVYETWSEETEQRPRSSGTIRRRSHPSIPTMARPVTGTQAKGFETVPGSQSPESVATVMTPTSGTRAQGSAATEMTPTVSQQGGSAATTIDRATRPAGSTQDRTVLAASPAGAASATVVVPSGTVDETPVRKRLVLPIAAAVLVVAAGLVALALSRSNPPAIGSPPTVSTRPPTNTAPPTVQPPSNPNLSTPLGVPTDTVVVNAKAARNREEVAELIRRIDSKLANAVSKGIGPTSKERQSLNGRVTALKARVESDDEQTVRWESAAILDAYDAAILAAAQRANRPPPEKPLPSPPRPQPEPRVPPTGTVAGPPVEPPAPRPAEPAPSITKADVVSFVGKIGNAYQNRDVAFFRQHDVNFNDARERGIRTSPSVRVDFEVLTVDIIDTTHARVTVKRTDTFPDRNVPPQVQKLSMSIRRVGDDWKIETSQRLP